MSPASLFLAGLAKSTQRVAASDLREVARTAFPDAPEPVLDLPWHTLRVDQGAAVREALRARYPPDTANRMIGNLRGVVKAGWRAGLVPWDAQLRLLAALPRLPGGRVTRGRSLTWDELQRVLAAAAGPEEHALLAVTTGVGFRRAEALSLTWDRVSRAKDGTRHIKVIGKGNKESNLRVPKWAAAPLDAWRRRCPERPRVFRWAHPEAVRRVLAAAAREAGVGPVAPHDLRRTFFALCVRSGVALPTIKRLMRHASIATTMKYDRRPDDEVAAEAAALDDLTLEPEPGNTGGRDGS